ncbi:thiamine pyrophosphate-binding protein [Clostridium polynesiense]|uniref:thiamine pyrophosphate-binding protein n=1 Tax=Clostridium polynesiense TaxID=1325933 RepID=UPI00058CC4DB|nr:thiamine pyrophosphate-binding protein [Clostridium polynesiense]
MDTFYTDERSVQILISLMKAHGIKKVVASPGTTNISFIASIQQDSFFEIYSSVDERSAAYIACGLAAESGEAVALSCTGATASRNYMSGLTEAYYRKLPVLAITSTQHSGRIGQNMPQVIDRTTSLNDTVNMSVQIPTIHDAEDEWACEVKLNSALLELNHRGGGPVHINLATVYSMNFTVKELPPARVIRRISCNNLFPELKCKKVGIFVGAHKKWSEELIAVVDRFCEKYNGVVFCDHTSNYKGKYGVNASLMCSQEQYDAPCRTLDVMIHLGDISGSAINMHPREVWRVNPDGVIRDTFRKLSYIFELEEKDFFEAYLKMTTEESKVSSYVNECREECKKLLRKVPELPFSNAWVAQKSISHLPEESVLHLGILNSLRVWDYFEVPNSVQVYSNTGGFGIDGGVSSLIGASLVDKDKIYFGVVGDLAFFYDMNVIGNRHVSNNIRLIVVNNGRGTEFRNYNHNAAYFGEEADKYMAAAGHFGNQSSKLVKHYVEDLGFEYLCATNKNEYLKVMDHFFTPDKLEKPLLLEVFTDSQEESNAIRIMNNLETTTKGAVKNIMKEVIGEKGFRTLKRLINP